MAIWLEYTVGGTVAAAAIGAGFLLNHVLNAVPKSAAVDTVTSPYRPSWAAAATVTDVSVKRIIAVECAVT